MSQRPGRRADVAARRADVLRLRIQHRPYAEIAAELGISASTARTDYQRGLEAYVAEQRASAATARERELAKLDALELEAWKVLTARHLSVSNGQVVTVEQADGSVEQLLDDGPVLAAMDRLLKVATRRARLLGLDAPVKVEVSDAVDQAIMKLAGELAAMSAPEGTSA